MGVWQRCPRFVWIPDGPFTWRPHGAPQLILFYFYFFFNFWTWNFRPRRISLEVSSKMECAKIRKLTNFDVLDLCSVLPAKRLSKSSLKPTWYCHFRCKGLQRIFFFFVFFLIFFKKWRSSVLGNPFSEGEGHFFWCENAFRPTLTDVWWKLHPDFYRRHPMELIKLRGDLCQKSTFGRPPKSVWIWVCVRGDENGVHENFVKPA